MEILFFFGIPMLLSVPLTTMLCRIRLARQKRVGGGTVLLGALIVPVLGAIMWTCIDPHFWSLREKGPGWVGMVILFVLVTFVSFVPSGVVVTYYERRSKK
jgi:hypothetical protein